jgi:hypothetical protein
VGEHSWFSTAVFVDPTLLAIVVSPGPHRRHTTASPVCRVGYVHRALWLALPKEIAAALLGVNAIVAVAVVVVAWER